MPILPEKILLALERLKAERKRYISLKAISGGYYAYESTSIWDKERRRVKKITHYLGKINDEGIFTPSNPRKGAHITANANRGALENRHFKLSKERYKLVEDEMTQAILTALSMNSRIGLQRLGEMVGLKASAVEWQKRQLEKRYGIRYILEMDPERLGYFGYIALVKFKSRIPSSDEIYAVLGGEPHVQLVLLTAGKFDMLIYFLAKNARDLYYLVFTLQSLTLFDRYPSKWYVTQHLSVFTYIPIRDEFFNLLAEKVWKRTKEKAMPGDGALLPREYIVLRELNRDGAMSFTEIDRKNRFGKGASRYTYYKLKQKGLLKRLSINMDGLPIKYTAIFQSGILYGKEFAKARKNLLLDIISDNMYTNKYALVSDIGAPFGYMLVMPVMEDDELQKTEAYLNKAIKGTHTRKLVVTKVLIGSFCHRRYDIRYTNQYRLLVEEYKVLKPQPLVSYEDKEET